MANQTKEKKSFQLPHLLFLLLGLMVIMSVLTYVLPAGEFVETASGGREYVQMERTPVHIGMALVYILQGISNSGATIAVTMAIGGGVEVALSTKALDRLIDYCLYRLQDRGSSVLLPCMFILMALLGGFGGSDALIAVIPIGVMFAKKFRMDPIVAAGVSFLGTMVGFSTSPTGAAVFVSQGIVGITPYSGFGVRLLNLFLCAIVGAIYVTLYAKRIEKDPSRSAMGDYDWQSDLGEVGALEKKELDPRDLLVTILFFAQFPVFIILNMKLGLGNAAIPAVMVPAAILIGLVNRMRLDEIGKTFERGVCNMGFICFIIGLAGAISLIMSNGHILDTIAYYACLPLQNLSTGFAAIGISMVVTVLNFFIPSATAKAAALMPIVKPMAETLGLTPQLAVQAFQVGDGFCNIISPFLGWTIGGLAIAKVPYQKWVKWVFPLLIILLVMEYVVLVVLSNIGWA